MESCQDPQNSQGRSDLSSKVQVIVQTLLNQRYDPPSFDPNTNPILCTLFPKPPMDLEGTQPAYPIVQEVFFLTKQVACNLEVIWSLK